MENEKGQNKRLEKELKKAIEAYNEQKSLAQRQRIAAAQLIKEKRRLLRELAAKSEQVEQLERKLGHHTSVSPDINRRSKVAVSFMYCICCNLR